MNNTVINELFQTSPYDWQQKCRLKFDPGLTEIFNKVALYENKYLNCEDVVDFIDNLPVPWINEQRNRVIDYVNFFINLKAYLIFARGADLFHSYDRLLLETLDASPWIKFHHELKLVRTTNGVEAKWVKYEVLRSGRMKSTSSLRRTLAGDFYKFNFNQAAPKLKLALGETIEPRLGVLRKLTALVGDMRDAVAAFQSEWQEPSTNQNPFRLEKNGSILSDCSSDIVELIAQVHQHDGKVPRSYRDFAYFEGFWNSSQLAALEEVADKNLERCLVWMKYFVFILSVRTSRLFFKCKRDYLYKIKEAREFGEKKKAESLYKIPFYPVVDMRKNSRGESLSLRWRKLGYVETTPRGILRQSRFIATNKSKGYSRSSFNGAGSEAKDFICFSIEPRFAAARRMVKDITKLRRALKNYESHSEKK